MGLRSLFWTPLLFFLVATLSASDASGICRPEACYPDTSSGVSWYGGTVWDGTDARWEAIAGGTWTFDSGVGSTILTAPTGNKIAGIHGLMEGWIGVLVSGTNDWSDIVDLTDLAAPLTACTCAMQDSVLVFEDLIGGGHSSNQDNWAASPWIDVSGGDLGRTGRVIETDGYWELPLLNYVAVRIMAQWRISGIPSAWTGFGNVPVSGFPNCTEAGAPAVYDLSSVIPSGAEEIRVGLGVVSYCSLFANCTGVSNSTPWFDNVRFGIFDATSLDLDNDGISDTAEDNAPNGGDANDDGTADSSQNHVASLQDAGASNYVTIEIAEESLPSVGPGFRCVSALAASGLPAPPAGVTFPCDLFEFTLAGFLGSSATVSMSVPVSCLTGRYYKYGPTPADTTDHWYEFSWDGTTGAVVKDGKVKLHFVDGDRGDDDLTANGIIVDKGGPGHIAGEAHAGQSSVPHVVYDPDGLLPYEVTVRDETGTPVNGANVEIHFSTETFAMICACSGLANPESAVTNPSGIATFNITAGGCIDPDSVSNPIEVKANGVHLAIVGAASSDAVDAVDRFPWQGWDPEGTCAVGLSDAVRHANSIKTRAYSICTDLDGNGRIGLIDAVLLTDPIKTASSCP